MWTVRGEIPHSESKPATGPELARKLSPQGHNHAKTGARDAVTSLGLCTTPNILIKLLGSAPAYCDRPRHRYYS